MKKTILAISGIMLLAFLIIVTVNAQNQDTKRSGAVTELKKEVSDVASTRVCPGMSGNKVAGCCGGDCSAMKCDASNCKAGKCDPVNCMNGSCNPSGCKGCKCDQALCGANCNKMSASRTGGPMNCNREIPLASK